MREEPAAWGILYEILTYCLHGRTMKELNARFDELTKNSAPLNSCVTYVSWLAELGALVQENGIWHTTQEGAEAAEIAAPSGRLSLLLKSRTVLRDYYISVLRACVEPKSRNEVEELLYGVYESSGFYPAYFTAELEDAGGLVWTGKWQTTNSGMEVIMPDCWIGENKEESNV